MGQNKQIIVTEEQGASLLDKVYGYVLNGIPNVEKPIMELVREYTSRYDSTEEAIKEFVRVQRIKVTTTGFVTGLGGAITLPLTLPADFVSSLYIELRTIAVIAAIRGFSVQEDTVKTAVYYCMVGNAVGDTVKQAGIKIGEAYVAKKLIPKISKDFSKKLTQAVGRRVLTKGGSKGIINLGKLVPVIGGIVGGAYNYAEINIVARKAKNFFN